MHLSDDGQDVSPLPPDVVNAPPDSSGSSGDGLFKSILRAIGQQKPAGYRPPVAPLQAQGMPDWVLPVALVGGVALVGLVLLSKPASRRVARR